MGGLLLKWPMQVGVKKTKQNMMHDLITSYGGTCDIEQPKKRLKRCCHFRKMQQYVIFAPESKYTP